MGCGASVDVTNGAEAELSHRAHDRASFNAYEAPLGSLKMRLFIDPKLKQLVLRIKQGKSLQPSDFPCKCSDAFVNVYFSGKKHGRMRKDRTKTRRKTLNPICDEQLHWYMPDLPEYDSSSHV